jgi:threonylcarbamoyladenosine tRNA methylthiotransferase MtaB
MYTFRYHTLGCKLNFAESSDIARQLRSMGMTPAGRGQQADVVLVNTCSVTDIADHKGRQLIHRLNRENPSALLVVTGCYAQLKSDEVADIDGVDMVLGAAEKFSAADKIWHALEQRTENKTIEVSNIRAQDVFHGSVSADDRTRHFLKIQDGCDYFCSYCTIPLARGKSRSATIEQVMKILETTIAQGAKEIVITGVNTGDFGRRNGENFYDLLQRMDTVDADVRYRISSIEPNLLTDEIIHFVAESRHFAPHFHIPLQSGSDDVLKIMRRRYDTSLFRSKVETIISLMPYAFIGVDVMTGVRGETDQHFNQTRNFLENIPVAQLHVFTYSERANTAMLDVDMVVPQKERKRRSEILHNISMQKHETFLKINHGRNVRVLWEGAKHDGMMAGFSENYIKVYRPYDKKLVNTFTTETL